MSKEIKLIPELRFPELVGSGEWEYENGDELFEPISNKNHNSDLPILAITQEQGAIPRDLIDYHVSVTEKSVESYKVVEVGDFIISLRSFQGGIEYSNYLGLCSPAYIILRKKRDLISDFYRHYFKSFLFIQDLNRNLEGIRDGKMISYKQFSEILIPNPKKDEQQKIASCLSSLDELLAAHNDKLDALKDHKKGLMQNLFPQEGETVPKVRFQEFEGDGEWVEDDIGSLFKFKQGVQVPVDNQFPEQEENRVRFIRIIDITSNTEPPRYIENPGDSHILSKDDLFMIRYGTPGLISIGFIGVIANNLFRLIWKSENEYQSKFWFYAFQRLESFIYNLSSSSSMPAISFSTLDGLKIGFPTNPDEQQRIASCLSAVDELINAQAEKIEQLQQHKKGLMQGLFPKIES